MLQWERKPWRHASIPSRENQQAASLEAHRESAGSLSGGLLELQVRCMAIRIMLLIGHLSEGHGPRAFTGSLTVWKAAGCEPRCVLMVLGRNAATTGETKGFGRIFVSSRVSSWTPRIRLISLKPGDLACYFLADVDVACPPAPRQFVVLSTSRPSGNIS